MKAHGVLNADTIQSIPIEKLEEIIKPSGFYKQKSERLKRVISILFNDNHKSIENLRLFDTEYLRTLLLMALALKLQTAYYFMHLTDRYS